MRYKILFLPIVVLFLLITQVAEATVGGPTVKYDFKYNPADQSIYYTEINHGGRGCPPILNKMSIHDGSVDTVFSCEQGEAMLSADRENMFLVYQQLNEITQGFENLLPISLKKNDFDIDVEFEREEYLDNDSDYVIRRIFSLDIFQKGNLIDQKEISSCDIDEPFLFEGYRIPNVEDKIMLLNSSKQDCFEGGYVSDSILIAENTEIFDREVSINQYKGNTTIIPSKNTLIVYEEDNDIDSNQPADNGENRNNDGNPDIGKSVDENVDKNASLTKDFLERYSIIVISIITFLLGLFLGKILLVNKNH